MSQILAAIAALLLALSLSAPSDPPSGGGGGGGGINRLSDPPSGGGEAEAALLHLATRLPAEAVAVAADSKNARRVRPHGTCMRAVSVTNAL